MFADGKNVNAELALIQQYEQAFARIKEVTGEEDIEVIVENFVKDEAENFALFNYVNELNSEIETLQDQVCTHFVRELYQTSGPGETCKFRNCIARAWTFVHKFSNFGANDYRVSDAFHAGRRNQSRHKGVPRSGCGSKRKTPRSSRANGVKGKSTLRQQRR